MPTPSFTSDQLTALLGEIEDPVTRSPLVQRLDFVDIKNDEAQIILQISHEDLRDFEAKRAVWEKQLLKASGLSQVSIGFTAKKSPSKQTSQQTGQQRRRRPPPRLPKPARYVIAVASGKGGVGKSTIAVNLAIALGRIGYHCGLLDGDIYGPSVPYLLGVKERPEQKDGKIIPVSAHGLRVMSMGLMVDEAAPMIWRGPMVMSAIEQMLRDVDWQNPDVLVVDLPPGTGDAQLTLMQRVEIDGAIIVTTPQSVALLDVRKGIEMFRKGNIPIFGIVENMGYFECKHCHTKHFLFGQHKVQRVANQYQSAILAQLPLCASLSEEADRGHPVEENTELGELFLKLAQDMTHHLAKQDHKPTPS